MGPVTAPGDVAGVIVTVCGVKLRGTLRVMTAPPPLVTSIRYPRRRPRRIADSACSSV